MKYVFIRINYGFKNFFGVVWYLLVKILSIEYYHDFFSIYLQCNVVFIKNKQVLGYSILLTVSLLVLYVIYWELL